MDIQLLASKQIEKKEQEIKAAMESKKDEPPAYDIKKLLSENNLNEAIKKYEENNMDKEAFWALDDGKIKEVLGIESYGERKHLVNLMAEIKKKHEKYLEELNKEILSDTKIDRDEVIQLVTCA